MIDVSLSMHWLLMESTPMFKNCPRDEIVGVEASVAASLFVGGLLSLLARHVAGGLSV
jgi:hypothetical protein